MLKTAIQAGVLSLGLAGALVAPILLPGNSPYHMAFPGTISLKAETIWRSDLRRRRA